MKQFHGIRLPLTLNFLMWAHAHLLSAEALAPCIMSRRMASHCPLQAAQCSGVLPSAFAVQMSCIKRGASLSAAHAGLSHAESCRVACMSGRTLRTQATRHAIRCTRAHRRSAQGQCCSYAQVQDGLGSDD